MSIKEIKSKKLYKEYSLQIPFEDIDKEINVKITKLIPSVSIPGFRKGKAPLNIVKKKYEDSVLNEVIQNVVNSKINDLIKEKKFNLFRQPKVNLTSYEKNKPAIIEIKIDLEPEIKLLDFKDLKINKYLIQFSKKDLDSQYNKFIETQKNYKKITQNRLIKKSDRVVINLDTTKEGLPEYLKSQKNLALLVDSTQEVLPGIGKELVNKFKQGDKKNISFNLSKILNDKNLNKVEYEIEVVSIEENVKFEINDEYLKNNGFKNEKDLKDFLKESTKNQYNQGISQIEKKQLMDLLDKKYKFDLPEGVLEEDFQEIWRRLEVAKKDNTLDKDDKSLTEDQLKSRYKKICERRVKLGVLMQYIAKKQNISISENELSKGIMQYAGQYPGQEKQIMEYLKKNPSSVESIRGPMLEQKILDEITSKATVVNKKINEDDYKKLEQDTFGIKSEK